jgi:hypothetical protein
VIIKRKIFALIIAFMVQNSAVTNVQQTSEVQEILPITADNLTVSAISVSCLKVEWNAEMDRDYTVTCEALSDGYTYAGNMYFEFKSNSLCYITGLREGTEYSVTVLPELKENETAETLPSTEIYSTETVEVIEEYEHEDGWTNCFTYESSAGLTLNPSWSAIQNCNVDVITNTGIMRDEYGDYCCAMGTFYGYVGDRFIVTLENGTQFTVKICDSKGDRRYHDFGNGGKSVIEFIYADGYLPDCVSFTGNYGSFNWSGLAFDNIQSIQKINYGDTVVY